jgi:hypothetical protein
LGQAKFWRNFDSFRFYLHGRCNCAILCHCCNHCFFNSIPSEVHPNNFKDQPYPCLSDFPLSFPLLFFLPFISLLTLTIDLN